MKFPKIEDLYSVYTNSCLVTTDTRNIKKNSVFFALKGTSFNGNEFAASAIENGASFAVIDESNYYQDNGKYILVEDTLQSLQQLANYHRKQFSIPFIGITGTNGKTTSKELIAAVLKTTYKIHNTAGNLNNHIGVPLTLLSMPTDTEIAIIEMGANHVGEIAELCSIAKPGFGIITNIGKAHLEGFGGFDGVKKAKGELYQFLINNKGVVFYNQDNEILKSLDKPSDTITFSISKSSQVNGQIIKANPFVSLLLSIDNNNCEIHSQLIGDYNAENIVAAACIGHFFKVPTPLICQALEEYTPSNNRSQFIQQGTNKIIMDAYNANPSSMEAALRNFENMQIDNKVVILGDMLELGEDSIVEHQKIINQIQNSTVSDVILVGPIFSSLKHSFTCFPSSNEASDYIKLHPITEKTILIKGSRGIKLEQIQNIL